MSRLLFYCQKSKHNTTITPQNPKEQKPTNQPTEQGSSSSQEPSAGAFQGVTEQEAGWGVEMGRGALGTRV